jgi:glycosyltransferase involved in cell wall biosynthesis
LLETQSVASREGHAGNGGGHRNAAWLSRQHWIVPDEVAAADIRRLRPQAQVAAWGLGLPDTSLMNAKDRQQVRAAICRSRADFDRYCGQPLIVYHGHLQPGRDSQWLWQLLAGLCENRPGISAWVTGDGGAVHGLWRQANEAGLEDRIIFPGVFSDLNDLYSMADLVVLPQQERLDNYNWLMAVAAGTPCLVARSPGTDRVTKLIDATETQHWLWTHVLPTDLVTWWEQARQVLDSREQAQALVREQRRAILRHYHQDDTLQQFERLLIRLQEES